MDVLMSVPTYTQEQLQSLRAALARGEKRVTFADKTVEYRTVDELKAAIADVEKALRQDAVATGALPPVTRQIRVNTSKAT
jgi:hypothetical protein